MAESWIWLLDTRVLRDRHDAEPPSALDAGCGPGYVMELLSRRMDVVGIDLDPDMVATCRARDLDVRLADVYELPFDDGTFDVVYCTFLMMWLDDPGGALREMARVSRQWVLCLAEPDFGARIDHPEGLSEVRDLVVEGFRARGADPFMGRKLRELYRREGLDVEVGFHPGVWDTDRLREEFRDEWGYLVKAAPHLRPEHLERIKVVWEDALEKGTAFSFNPIFWAIGGK
ncbi:MAG: class I SAM-dependent methyltransferase [Thermoplasmata archaeon]|nr:MAG: class I SAM-dependent methyltransferase [Thermoplasmata archaeon]